jgi:hypothetical protein
MESEHVAKHAKNITNNTKSSKLCDDTNNNVIALSSEEASECDDQARYPASFSSRKFLLKPKTSKSKNRSTMPNQPYMRQIRVFPNRVNFNSLPSDSPKICPSIKGTLNSLFDSSKSSMVSRRISTKGTYNGKSADISYPNCDGTQHNSRSLDSLATQVGYISMQGKVENEAVALDSGGNNENNDIQGTFFPKVCAGSSLHPPFSHFFYDGLKVRLHN